MKPDVNNNTDVALQGNIAIIELNTIFQFFDYSSASGELRIIGDDNSASFFFRNGLLIFGALSVNQKKIGGLLIDSKLITPGEPGALPGYSYPTWREPEAGSNFCGKGVC